MKCPKCLKKMKVMRTVTKNGSVNVRYYKCPHCGNRIITTERKRPEESTVDSQKEF